MVAKIKNRDLENFLTKKTDQYQKNKFLFLSDRTNDIVTAGIPAVKDSDTEKKEFNFSESYEINLKDTTVRVVCKPLLIGTIPDNLKTASNAELKKAGYLIGFVLPDKTAIAEEPLFTYEEFKEKYTNEKYKPIIELITRSNEINNPSRW